MQEYTSPNSDLILKKTNSIVGQKITDFPQYKSALPKDFKYPRNDLQNIQSKEWFDEKKKFKNFATFQASDTAKQYKFIFIPNYRLKSIINSTDYNSDKTIIKTPEYGVNMIHDSLTNVLNATTDGIYKNTLAIYYEGSSPASTNKTFYKRQIWYNDLEAIPRDNILANNEDAGVYIKYLSNYNEMELEDSINYADINTNVVPNIDIKNSDGLTFIAKLGDDYTTGSSYIRPSSWYTHINRNNAMVWRLEQIEYNKNEYRIKIYQPTKKEWWYLVPSGWLGYVIVKKLIESNINDAKVYSIQIDSNDAPNSFKIEQGAWTWQLWEGWEWGLSYNNDDVNDDRQGWRSINPQGHHILIDSMKNLFKKILTNPDMGVSQYNCMKGLGSDSEIIKLLSSLSMSTLGYETTKSFNPFCITSMNTFCGKNSGNSFPNLFNDECKVYCNDKSTDCDSMMRNYCERNKPVDSNIPLDNEYLSKCGCFMGIEFYDKYRSQFPSGYQFPTCEKKWIYPFCLNASMQDKASKRSTCTSNIVNCIQEVKVNNSGKIIGDIKIDQTTSACKQLINPPSTSPPGSPPSSPSSTGTNFLPGTPPTSPTSPTTPIKPPDLKPPAPAPAPADEKILGMEKNVFYGVSAGAVLLLLIIIGFMASRSSNSSSN
jgi:hypothetical protein